MHRVVVPFPYAGNGYTLEHLNVGAERDFGRATAGLLAEGFISENEGALVVDAADAVIDAPEPPITTADAEELDIANAEPTQRARRKRK